MSISLSLNLLGPFEASTENGSPIRFRSDMERAVLAYIVEKSNHSYSRDSLAEIFWPDYASKKSHTNLRQVLFGIRKALRDQDIQSDIFIAGHDPRIIQLNPDIAFLLDTKKFHKYLPYKNPHHKENAELTPEQARQLTLAVSLYRGEFLENNRSIDKTFDGYEWVAQTRKFYFHKTFKALGQLTNFYEKRGDFDLAYDFVFRQIQLDPLEESGHRQLMKIYARDGRHNAALEQYDTCCQLLSNQLGVKPQSDTTILYQQIRCGKFK